MLHKMALFLSMTTSHRGEINQEKPLRPKFPRWGQGLAVKKIPPYGGIQCDEVLDD
jgi:hypothetical protein